MRTTTEVPREGPNPPAATSVTPVVDVGADAATLEVRGVSRTFAPLRRGREGVPAIADVSLTARPGQVVAVVGPSGCGKSTLLEIVCGLQAPDGGTVDGPPAVLMPQRDGLLPWLTALDNAALPLRIAGTRKAEARGRAHALLTDLGLAGFERAAPDELSGGMRQRVAFARTLLSGKPVLCLDEPFGALDAITRPELHAWLAATLARAPRTVLLVTHDVEEAAVLADRIVVLTPRPGRVAATLEADHLPPRPERRATDAAVQELRARALEVLRA